MRREWLIVLGVLLPFAALLAVGSMWPSSHSVAASPAVAAPAPLPSKRFETGALVVQPDAAAPEMKRRTSPIAPEIEAAVNAVTPEITACFRDNGAAHLHGSVAVTIGFEPTREGHFRHVSLETKVADPRLAACLEDVLEEVTYVPSGRETFEPSKHTFVFDAP